MFRSIEMAGKTTTTSFRSATEKSPRMEERALSWCACLFGRQAWGAI